VLSPPKTRIRNVLETTRNSIAEMLDITKTQLEAALEEQIKEITEEHIKTPIRGMNDADWPKYSENELDMIKMDIYEQHKQELTSQHLKYNKLLQQYESEVEERKKFERICDEYQHTLDSMIETKVKELEEQNLNFFSKIRQLEAENKKLETEKSELGDYSQKVDQKFAQLQQRYESMKELEDNFRKNEVLLKDSLAKAHKTIQEQDERYQQLQNYVKSKWDDATKQYNQLKESSTKEVNVLKTKLKQSELKVQALEKELQTKKQENEQLTKICDELMEMQK